MKTLKKKFWLGLKSKIKTLLGIRSIMKKEKVFIKLKITMNFLNLENSEDQSITLDDLLT
jgi:hypothetical protein